MKLQIKKKTELNNFGFEYDEWKNVTWMPLKDN